MSPSSGAPAAPLAAIDVGSNTLHLAVARPRPDQFNLTLLADETEMVRFGADISATGRIGDERLRRALGILRAQVATARIFNATHVLGIATEGVRAAQNSADVRARIVSETGLDLHIITGEQEAALTYWGALSGAVDAGEPLAQRRAVLDLGGGSLELVVGMGTQVEWRVALPLGSGLMHDKHAPSDPPRMSELETVRRLTDEALARQPIPGGADEAIAVGGSATALVRFATSSPAVPNPEGASPPGTPFLQSRPGRLTRDQLDAIIDELCHLSANEVVSRYGIQAARAPLLAPGAMVLRTALERLGADRMRVSRRGIREGAILAYARAGDAWLDAATTGAGWAH